MLGLFALFSGWAFDWQGGDTIKLLVFLLLLLQCQEYVWDSGEVLKLTSTI